MATIVICKNPIIDKYMVVERCMKYSITYSLAIGGARIFEDTAEAVTLINENHKRHREFIYIEITSIDEIAINAHKTYKSMNDCTVEEFLKARKILCK